MGTGYSGAEITDKAQKEFTSTYEKDSTKETV